MRNFVTDPGAVKTAAPGKTEENSRLKAFLYQADRARSDIEGYLSFLTQQATEAVDCTACGECCRKVHPLLNAGDIRELADGLKLTPRQVKQNYLTKHIAKPNDYIFKALPCPLLDEGLCRLYAHRPKACREFPRMDGDYFFDRLDKIFHYASFCPIVFNVIEGLKIELGVKRVEG